jgi:hypothetical protein
MEIQVDQQQLKKIINNLSPQLYERAVADMMRIAKDDGRGAMEQAIDGGTGVAVRSIVAKSTPVMVEVFSTIKVGTGMKIEHGRKPGDAPGLVQIARWREGSARRRNLDGYTKEQFKELQNIQDAIKSRGSKAKHFLKGTRERLQSNIGGYMSKIVNEIKENWRR